MIGKSALLETIAGKNRGLLATEPQRQAILSAIAQLEDRNPTPRPIEALDLLEGDWRLVYTTSRGILGIEQVPFLEGIVSVAARFKPISEKRVDVKFERSILGLQRLIGYQTPDHFIHQIESGQKLAAIDFSLDNRDQQGWLDTTYLDEDMRIGRGNEGSVFVLTKG